MLKMILYLPKKTKFTTLSLKHIKNNLMHNVNLLRLSFRSMQLKKYIRKEDQINDIYIKNGTDYERHCRCCI